MGIVRKLKCEGEKNRGGAFKDKQKMFRVIFEKMRAISKYIK